MQFHELICGVILYIVSLPTKITDRHMFTIQRTGTVIVSLPTKIIDRHMLTIQRTEVFG